MGNTSKGFLISFFNFFLLYMVVINYVGWSGAYLNGLSATPANWQGTYFGFESFRRMTYALNQLWGNGFFSVTNFLKWVNELTYAIQFGLPDFIVKVGTGSFNLLDLGKLLITIFTQPFLVIGYIFLLLGYVLYYAGTIISVLLLAFGGSFNVTMANPLDWSDVIDSYNSIRVFGQWNSNWVAPFSPLGCKGLQCIQPLLDNLCTLAM